MSLELSIGDAVSRRKIFLRMGLGGLLAERPGSAGIFYLKGFSSGRRRWPSCAARRCSVQKSRMREVVAVRFTAKVTVDRGREKRTGARREERTVIL